MHLTPIFFCPGRARVCVCAQTTDWFELRANIYREWVAAQLWCAAQNFLWFACRSQSSVLPFLCSLIINKPLTEYITGWAVTQQALDCYLKLVMNDSRPITGKRDTHINERWQRVSQSEMSKSMTQTGWDIVNIWERFYNGSCQAIALFFWISARRGSRYTGNKPILIFNLYFWCSLTSCFIYFCFAKEKIQI